jgi:hypothetical protein
MARELRRCRPNYGRHNWRRGTAEKIAKAPYFSDRTHSRHGATLEYLFRPASLSFGAARQLRSVKATKLGKQPHLAERAIGPQTGPLLDDATEWPPRDLNLPLAARPRVGHIRPYGAVAEWLKAAVC